MVSKIRRSFRTGGLVIEDGICYYYKNHVIVSLYRLWSLKEGWKSKEIRKQKPTSLKHKLSQIMLVYKSTCKSICVPSILYMFCIISVNHNFCLMYYIYVQYALCYLITMYIFVPWFITINIVFVSWAVWLTGFWNKIMYL